MLGFAALAASPDRRADQDDGEVIDLEGVAPPTGAASEREIEADEIAAAAARSSDDLLALVPGMHLSRHGAEGKGPQFFWRGFDAVHGADLEVRVAGIPINELSNVHGQGYVDLNFAIPELVTSIRARKGALALDQGLFAMAGSIDLSLGVPEEARGRRIGYESGTTNRHRLLAVASPRGGDGATFVAVEGMRDAGFGENRESARASALAQSRHDVAGGLASLELFGAAYSARFGEPGVVPLADYRDGHIDFADTYARGEGASQRALAGARLQGERGPHRFVASAHAGIRELELDENFTGYLTHPEIGDRLRQEHRFVDASARALYEHALSESISLFAGAELRADRFSQREDNLDGDAQPWAQAAAIDGRHAAAGAALGVHLERSRVTARAGLRADTIHIRAEDQLTSLLGSTRVDALSPRLSAAWRIADPITAFAAYGRGARPPQARDLVAPFTNDTIPVRRDPEMLTSDTAELGVALRPHDALRIRGTAFGAWSGEELVFDHVSGHAADVGATRRLGGELALKARPAPWLAVRADATAVSARLRDRDEAVPGAPALVSSLAAMLARDEWRGGARLSAHSPRPLAHGGKGMAVAVLDLTGRYRRGDLELSLSLENVLGARYHQGEFVYASHFDVSRPRSELPRIHYAPGPPRMARASLSYSF